MGLCASCETRTSDWTWWLWYLDFLRCRVNRWGPFCSVQSPLVLPLPEVKTLPSAWFSTDDRNWAEPELLLWRIQTQKLLDQSSWRREKGMLWFQSGRAPQYFVLVQLWQSWSLFLKAWLGFLEHFCARDKDTSFAFVVVRSQWCDLLEQAGCHFAPWPHLMSWNQLWGFLK